MSNEFPFLEISEKIRLIVGKPDKGSRTYRRNGSDEDVGKWYDALSEIFPDERFVSPGGVSMYAPVSRAGVHKRIKEGKLTVFLFHVVESKRSMFGYQKKLKHLPYGYVPVSECKAWAKELEMRPDRQRAEEADGDGDFDGHFLNKDPEDAKDKSVKYEHETITADKLKVLVEVLVDESLSKILPKKLNQQRQQARSDKEFEKIIKRKKRNEQRDS